MAISRWILRMGSASGKIVEKIETYFMFNNFFPDNRAIWDIVEECGTTGQATADYNTAHALCVLHQ